SFKTLVPLQNTKGRKEAIPSIERGRDEVANSQHAVVEHQGRGQRLPIPHRRGEGGGEESGLQRRLPPEHFPQGRVEGLRRRGQDHGLPRASRGGGLFLARL
ncbi:hypothetical protein F2P56_025676, partial [Juglans regia]